MFPFTSNTNTTKPSIFADPTQPMKPMQGLFVNPAAQTGNLFASKTNNTTPPSNLFNSNVAPTTNPNVDVGAMFQSLFNKAPSTVSSLFSTPESTPNSSKSKFSQTPVTPASDLFKQPPAASTSNLLFTQQPNTPPSNLFTKQPASTTPASIFTQQPNTSTSNVFTKQPNASTPANIFTQQPAVSTSNLFTKQPQQATTPTTNVSNIFTQRPATTVSNVTNLFNQQPATSTSASNIFTKQPTSNTPVSIFTQQPAASTSNIFTQQPATSTSPAPFNLFTSNKSSTQITQPNTQNLFTNNQPTPSNLFTNNQSSTQGGLNTPNLFATNQSGKNNIFTNNQPGKSNLFTNPPVVGGAPNNLFATKPVTTPVVQGVIPGNVVGGNTFSMLGAKRQFLTKKDQEKLEIEIYFKNYDQELMTNIFKYLDDVLDLSPGNTLKNMRVKAFNAQPMKTIIINLIQNFTKLDDSRLEIQKDQRQICNMLDDLYTSFFTKMELHKRFFFQSTNFSGQLVDIQQTLVVIEKTVHELFRDYFHAIKHGTISALPEPREFQCYLSRMLLDKSKKLFEQVIDLRYEEPERETTLEDAVHVKVALVEYFKNIYCMFCELKQKIEKNAEMLEKRKKYMMFRGVMMENEFGLGNEQNSVEETYAKMSRMEMEMRKGYEGFKEVRGEASEWGLGREK